MSKRHTVKPVIIRCDPGPLDACLMPAVGQMLATKADGTFVLSPPMCAVHIRDVDYGMTVAAPKVPVLIAPWVPVEWLLHNPNSGQDRITVVDSIRLDAEGNPIPETYTEGGIPSGDES